MKFVKRIKYTTVQFEAENGTEYRTDENGYCWERLYGNSWEQIFLTEEEEDCVKAMNNYISTVAQR